LMMGGKTARNMYCSNNNKEYCMTLHLVGCTSENMNWRCFNPQQNSISHHPPSANLKSLNTSQVSIKENSVWNTVVLNTIMKYLFPLWCYLTLVFWSFLCHCFVLIMSFHEISVLKLLTTPAHLPLAFHQRWQSLEKGQHV
jgi:hypothetical protein